MPGRGLAFALESAPGGPEGVGDHRPARRVAGENAEQSSVQSPVAGEGRLFSRTRFVGDSEQPLEVLGGEPVRSRSRQELPGAGFQLRRIGCDHGAPFKEFSELGGASRPSELHLPLAPDPLAGRGIGAAHADPIGVGALRALLQVHEAQVPESLSISPGEISGNS